MFNLFSKKSSQPKAAAPYIAPAPITVPTGEETIQPKECWSVRWMSHNEGSLSCNIVEYCEFFDNEAEAKKLYDQLIAAFSLLRYEPRSHYAIHHEGKKRISLRRER